MIKRFGLFLIYCCVAVTCLLAAVSADEITTAPGNSVFFQSDGNYWHFRNDEFEGYVSKSTGLLERLTSLKPSIKDIISSGGNGLTAYIEHQDSGWVGQLNVLDTASIDQGTEDGRVFHRLTCTLKPVARNVRHDVSTNVASAEIEYRLFDDYLGIKVKVNYLANDPSQYKVGVYQPFDPSTWPNQQYYNWAHQSTQKLTLRYSYQQGHYNDASWNTALYPMAILISPDRYFLWGYLDLASYVVLSPNDVPNISPSFAIYPTGISNGSSYSFDFVYKTFPRPENTYTEVLRWYGEHFYDSDPDFNQGPVRLEHQTSRTVGYGNAAVMIPDFSLLPGALQNRERVLAMEDWMLKHKIVHLWYMKLNDWRESGPTSGRFVMPTVAIETSAEEIKSEIQRLQAKGFKVYMYFREIWWFKKSEWQSPSDVTSPPYKRWINKTPDGKLVSLYYGEKGYDTLGLNEPAIAGEIDFNNDEARAWYFKRLKECVEYYNPAGIAFDFGWSHIFATNNKPTYSASDQNSDMFQGYLKIQYEVYKWLQKNHPEKKVLINSPGGAPSQLYCDAGLLEIDKTPPHDPYHDASKAFNTACIDFITGGDLWQPTDLLEQEKLYKTRLNVIPSLGSSYGAYGPNGAPVPAPPAAPDYSRQYVQTISTDLTDFSARTNAVPLITDGKVLSTNSPEVVGSVWADKKALMLAIYNNDSTDQIELLVNRDVLERNGQMLSMKPSSMDSLKFTFTAIDANGKVTKSQMVFDCIPGKQQLKFRGTLAKGCLLLIERQ